MKPFLMICSCLLFFSYIDGKASVLYKGLNPKSIPEHLAFYHLFPDTEEGQKALAEASFLLSKTSKTQVVLNQLPKSFIDTLVFLITKSEGAQTAVLNPRELEVIREIASHLPNRKLKGYNARNEREILLLDSHEIDLAKGLFLSQGEEDASLKEKMASYEAMIDLMALQILTEVDLNDPPEKKFERSTGLFLKR